jgi:hypothetical protein
MVDLLNNFLNPLKLFLAVESDSTKSVQLRIEGVRRERKTAERLWQTRLEMGERS